MGYELILYEKKDRVATVTLNKPENLNALAPGMVEERVDVFQLMEKDREVLVTIITGAGRGFCAGAFVKDPQTHSLENPAESVQRSGGGVLQAMDEYPKPLRAAVNGPAYGAGLNMVVLSDIVIASREASFCFPMARLGIIPAYAGASRLALFVGKAKASEMALMGKAIDAEDAGRWGLANKVVSPEELLDEAMAWAVDITRVAPISARLAGSLSRSLVAPPIPRKRSNDNLPFLQFCW